MSRSKCEKCLGQGFTGYKHRGAFTKPQICPSCKGSGQGPVTDQAASSSPPLESLPSPAPKPPENTW